MTLIEIMVATMILTIISTVMLGVLFTATRIYEVGERSRAANDEAMAIIAQIERDLDRMVPPSDRGEFRAQADNNGNVTLGLDYL